MDAAKLAKDRGHLSPQGRYRTQIVAPTVTRRPALDAMLADIALIAKGQLELMRVTTLNLTPLRGYALKDFKELSEMVLKCARLEMAVEKHIEERMAVIDNDEIVKNIVGSLEGVLNNYPELDEEARNDITAGVLEALGLDEDDE